MGTRLTDPPAATGHETRGSREARFTRDYRTLTPPAMASTSGPDAGRCYGDVPGGEREGAWRLTTDRVVPGATVISPRLPEPPTLGASHRQVIGYRHATLARALPATTTPGAPPSQRTLGEPRPPGSRRRPPIWLLANVAVLLVALLAVGVPRVLQADAEGACGWHTVIRGDTLGDLGWQYHSSALAIARANHIRNPNLIYVGQRLCIPTTWYAQAHAAPTVPKHAAPAVPAAAFSATVLGGKVAAPNNAGHYVSKYGFDWPGAPRALSTGERQRLVAMLPYAVAATARFNQRYGEHMEPQLLLFWTHAEGIGARESYSNCANQRPPRGTDYFSYITNCRDPSFWQLGYGNQFSVIGILKTAFLDMHGNPNDPRLVQRVGQAVLNVDRAHGTTPRCGGYSCAFPALTIDQIMAGVSLGHMTTDDWWASVLSRDPGINSYMLARALTWFNHNATRTWVGCYYAEPCWGYESNRLGDILAAWPSLRAAAGV